MPKKILVADDSRMFRLLEQNWLEKHGYQLLHAGDGAQAVSIANVERPDLVVLDVQMPVMDGNKALSILKSNERTSRIPVLMLTAEAGTRERKAMTELGAAGVLAKPVSPEALLAAVRSAIGESS
ncbi:MAG TPA: response regulator [Polyangiaceae bacterium]|nr:response regulator [Polyangiaceae bacterium]